MLSAASAPAICQKEITSHNPSLGRRTSSPPRLSEARRLCRPILLMPSFPLSVFRYFDTSVLRYFRMYLGTSLMQVPAKDCSSHKTATGVNSAQIG